MFCSRCGKTLMPEDKQCPHCGTPVGESRFEGTPYTSAQPHILPDTPAGQASAAYTRTTYTTMTDEQRQEGAVDSRTTYRPVYDEASAPEEIRRDMRAVIDGNDAADEAPLPPVEELPEDVKTVFVGTVAHRLLLSAEARAQGLSAERLLSSLLDKVPAPGV